MTNLWDFKNEDLAAEISAKTRVNQSGAYVFTIKEAYINKTTNSFSTACTLELENETHKAKLSIWFKNKNGDTLEYNRKKLNRLMYLCKLKAEDLKVDVKKVKDYQGNDIDRQFLPAFVGKEIGVFLQVTPPRADQQFPNFNIDDFFAPKTKQTCDEILGKEKGTAKYDFYTEKYAQDAPVKTGTATPRKTTTAPETAELGDDDFPF